jgi:sec-independent protein translocase protein TatC
MLILSWIGIVEPGFFRARRKYALVLAFVFGAILTPPDVPSQIIMAGCLLVLYELGIILATLAERRRLREYGPYDD